VDDALPGFRLERLELLNWGTFDGSVQVLEPSGAWALLIGDNGSGKSTAIDALRTLLVPPKMLNYNDASGDGRRTTSRDRTRRSYIRGAWASSSTIDSTSATTQYLRDTGDLSAILAVFGDAARESHVTLAQVLWMNDDQVRELYAVTPARRGLGELLDGKTNTTDIRRGARAGGWDLYDSFSAYSERMRGLLHIPGDKALEVFNRAIGMKEVGDIDAFIRQFMLPSADTLTFIRDTIQPHYRALLDCWTAITRAERQVELLRPVTELGSRIATGETRITALKRLQECLRPFFITTQIARLRAAWQVVSDVVRSISAANAVLEVDLRSMREERERLSAALTSSEVGAQLQRIDERLQDAQDGRQRAQLRRKVAEHALAVIGDDGAFLNPSAFMVARERWPHTSESNTSVARDAEERRASHKLEQEKALLSRVELSKEVASVERNRVNIPRRYLELRANLAASINVPVESLPFAGELMEVLEAYSDWTSAIERLLHGFGLSLLVPESSYREAADYVNRTQLGLRLVFHRVPARAPALPNLTNDRVPGRLRFRTEHPLCMWVVAEMAHYFNHRCCANVAELEHAEFGLTQQGLIRNGTRHIKDDGRVTDDASGRILGWSTENKLAALRHQIAEADRRATERGQAAAAAGKEADSARARADAARDLLTIMEFDDVSPESWSAKILRLRTERELLEQSSSELQAVRARIADLAARTEVADRELRNRHAEFVHQERELERFARLLASRENELRTFIGYDHDTAAAELAALAPEVPTLHVTTENLDEVAHTAHVKLQGQINREQGMVREAGERLVSCMSDFLAEFPEFRQTLSAERAFVDDFCSVMLRIEAEELPQYRERFEQYLNENLVGNLSMLNRRLDEHREAIDGRIDEINLALRAIAYSDDTYVQLRPMPRVIAEVSDFRRALRDCFERGIAPGPDDRMQIFERVRALLDEFQREPERTQRVCDVRNWVSAGVSERRHSDDSEANYYSATTGKSGGQKAKLAFTILASALSAQYGLSTALPNAQNFRLVVIDEAFSRTDESNSTRAMKLFAHLGFQLLIVGPFDAKAKLAVPFVKTIHLASNPAGDSSVLTALTRADVERSVNDVISS